MDKMDKNIKPGTALPELRVEWFYEHAALTTGSGKRVAVFRDSAKADMFEEISRRANAYPQLVEDRRRLVDALRDLTAICDNVPVFQLDDGKTSVKAVRLAGKFTASHTSARALLRSLGESQS